MLYCKYFLFQNQFIHGKKNAFVDDCGAWVGGSVKHTYYVKENNDSRLRLEKKKVFIVLIKDLWEQKVTRCIIP